MCLTGLDSREVDCSACMHGACFCLLKQHVHCSCIQSNTSSKQAWVKDRSPQGAEFQSGWTPGRVFSSGWSREESKRRQMRIQQDVQAHGM